jgi:hypothetical protein
VKLQPNSRKGIFLGFLPNTTKNILWYDVHTGRIKIAKHVRLDEGLNDLPMDAIPPHWGIRFTRQTYDSSLRPGAPYDIRLDSNLPSFPVASHPLQLTGFVDAAHANDLRTRRSTTGFAFLLCGGAVAYRSKTQTVTATSSTEAEFLAAITAAKTAKYLRAVLFGLGFSQSSPTPIYIDNISAIQIINARRPTERTRHIDIQAFAIQDWKEKGDIFMLHIPGVINPSDSLTKPTGWVLHSRHCRRLMGHYTT